MIVYPAIDIRNGCCVRLLQGSFEKETVYGKDPVAMAKRLKQAGAVWIHVVDLDGARTGVGVNLPLTVSRPKAPAAQIQRTIPVPEEAAEEKKAEETEN